MVFLLLSLLLPAAMSHWSTETKVWPSTPLLSNLQILWSIWKRKEIFPIPISLWSLLSIRNDIAFLCLVIVCGCFTWNIPFFVYIVDKSVDNFEMRSIIHNLLISCLNQCLIYVFIKDYIYYNDDRAKRSERRACAVAWGLNGPTNTQGFVIFHKNDETLSVPAGHCTRSIHAADHQLGAKHPLTPASKYVSRETLVIIYWKDLEYTSL